MSDRPPFRSAVQLYKYDLTNGLAAQLSQSMLGCYIEAIWHTSVVCYGFEFYFDGGIGVASAVPGSTRFGRPLQILDMGFTSVPAEDFHRWLASQRDVFGPNSYSLLARNCNHFSSAALRFLNNSDVPSDVSSMIDRCLATPLGAMLRPMLETMSAAPSLAATSLLRGDESLGQDELQSRCARVDEAVNSILEHDDFQRAGEILGLLSRLAHDLSEDPVPARAATLNVSDGAFAAAQGDGPTFTVLSVLGYEPSSTNYSNYELNPKFASRSVARHASESADAALATWRELQTAINESKT